MRKLLHYVREYGGYVAIMVYCVIDFNWVGAVGWFMVLANDIHKQILNKLIDEYAADVDKWHQKYLDIKYRNKL